ncbi:hypothetical protein HMPREF3198_00158 [Winkia neuii]|nr:hypothetical protein HMPREF3198_00158 [Winkia neuii]
MPAGGLLSQDCSCLFPRLGGTRNCCSLVSVLAGRVTGTRQNAI